MLMTRERRPAIRTLRGWAIHVLQEAGAIANARSMAGPGIVPTRTRGNARSRLRGSIHRMASPRIRPSRRSTMSSIDRRYLSGVS